MSHLCAPLGSATVPNRNVALNVQHRGQAKYALIEKFKSIIQIEKCAFAFWNPYLKNEISFNVLIN